MCGNCVANLRIFQVQFQHRHFKCNFNKHISGTVSTRTFQVQFHHSLHVTLNTHTFFNPHTNFDCHLKKQLQKLQKKLQKLINDTHSGVVICLSEAGQASVLQFTSLASHTDQADEAAWGLTYHPMPLGHQTITTRIHHKPRFSIREGWVGFFNDPQFTIDDSFFRTSSFIVSTLEFIPRPSVHLGALISQTQLSCVLGSNIGPVPGLKQSPPSAYS